jgi:outer membrane protein assembly factor BamB
MSRWRRSGLFAIILVALVAATAVAATASNWPAYMNGPLHQSWNSTATAITPSNAASVVKAWKWQPDAPTMTGQPGRGLWASPTVVDGRIYIGAKTGVFYALDEATGAVVWKTFLGYVTKTTCGTQGIVSTATVANDPTSGKPTVYVASPNGIMFALDAATGLTVWQHQVVKPSQNVNDFFLWSSPTLANGRIYIGLSSQCDKPLVRAGVAALDQASGNLLGTYYTVAAGRTGGSVWSSVAVDGNSVFVTTGNPGQKVAPGDAYSIVRLDGTSMVKQDIFTIPLAEQTTDADFGASPTLFTATINGQQTAMVGACDKNGIFYALRRNNLAAGPVWQRRLGNAGTDPNSCIGSASFDGARLYVGSNATTINGTAYAGSIRALDPDNGNPLWQIGLPNHVINTPTVNGSGVVAAGSLTFGSGANETFLIEAATGQILKRFTTIMKSGMFGEATFADNFVFFPTVANGLFAYRV